MPELPDKAPGSHLEEAAVFRTVGVFDGEPDLGRRAKEIVRRELGGSSFELLP